MQAQLILTVTDRIIHFIPDYPESNSIPKKEKKKKNLFMVMHKWLTNWKGRRKDVDNRV